MKRLFEEKKITAKGKLLPREEFLRSCPLTKPVFVPEKMEGVIKEAESYLDLDIPFIPLSAYRDFWVTGNRSSFGTPYSKRRDMLVHLSLAEYYEHEGRFASKLCDVLWAVLEETTWVKNAHAVHNPTALGATVPPVYDETTLHGLDIFSAATGAILTMVLTLNGDTLDSFSPILRERIEYEVTKRLIKPFVTNHHSWSGAYGTKCNNWCTWICTNMLYVAGYLEKREAMREAIVSRVLSYLDNYTTYIPEDGGCDEGPGYWNGAGAAYFGCLETIHDLTGGAIDIFSDPLVKAMGEYIMKVNVNADRFLNFADCSSQFYADGFMIMRFGARCGSEALLAFGKMMAMNCSTRPGTNMPVVHLRDLQMPRPTDATVTRAPRSTWMPYLKVGMLRESEDTSVGICIGVKGGHNGESHNHNDVGSFMIYNNGEPSVIDPGSVSYTRDTFGKNRYTIWAMQSHYHNLPAFGGVGERNGKQFASSREEYDGERQRISLGLEGAYESAAMLEEYTRSYELSDGAAIITDDIRLKEAREIDFRLITHRRPEPMEDGRLALANGVALSYDPRLSYSVEPFVGANSNPMKGWGTPELYRLHFTLTAKEFVGSMRFEKI